MAALAAMMAREMTLKGVSQRPRGRSSRWAKARVAFISGLLARSAVGGRSALGLVGSGGPAQRQQHGRPGGQDQGNGGQEVARALRVRLCAQVGAEPELVEGNRRDVQP